LLSRNVETCTRMANILKTQGNTARRGRNAVALQGEPATAQQRNRRQIASPTDRV
jgi:hypothetical protein